VWKILVHSNYLMFLIIDPILFYFTRGVCVYSVNLIASGRGKGPSITKTLIGIKGRVGWDESTLYAFIWKKRA